MYCLYNVVVIQTTAWIIPVRKQQQKKGKSKFSFPIFPEKFPQTLWEEDYFSTFFHTYITFHTPDCSAIPVISVLSITLLSCRDIVSPEKGNPGAKHLQPRP